MDEEEWFVTNGEWRMGPLALDDLVEVLGREHAPGSVLVWKTGLETWTRPELVHELTTAAAARPPARAGLPGGPGVRAEASAGGNLGGGAAASPGAPWFRVGTSKLLLMCVVTFGYYQLYWFYQQWRHVQRRGERVHPAPRALLNLIFCYPLFRRVSADAMERGVPRVPSALACAVGWILPWVAALLIWASQSLVFPLPLSVSVPLSLLQLLPLALVQRAASAAALAAVPGADPNTRLTPINWLVIALGVMILLAALQATPTPSAPAKPVQTETTQAARTSIDHAAQTIR